MVKVKENLASLSKESLAVRLTIFWPSFNPVKLIISLPTFTVLSCPSCECSYWTHDIVYLIWWCNIRYLHHIYTIKWNYLKLFEILLLFVKCCISLHSFRYNAILLNFDNKLKLHISSPAPGTEKEWVCERERAPHSQLFLSPDDRAMREVIVSVLNMALFR